MADRRDDADPSADWTLNALSKRLGSLEQSLTVVAAEIGITGFPTFRHLDPQQVYDEAVRLARAQMLGLEARLHGAVEALAQRQEQAERRQTADGDQAGGRAAQIERQLQIVALRLQELTDNSARRDDRALAERLTKLEHTVSGIDRRLDILLSQADGLTPSNAQIGARKSSRVTETPPPPVAIERNKGLENRLIAQEQSLAQLRDQLAGISAYIQRLGGGADQRLATAEQPMSDLNNLRDEILAKMRQWLEERSASNALPLMSGPDMPSPLVMGAAERAIVRLTHRIERMEEWRDSVIGDTGRRGRSLKSRLFES